MKYFKQSADWTCGPACMHMVLASFGIRKSEKALARLMHSNKRIGTKNYEFPALCEKLKLSYVVRRNGSIGEIKEFLPWCKVIVCYWLPDEKTGHYAVVKKIGKRIHLIDPWLGSNHSLSIAYFSKHWYGKEDRRWFIAIKL